MFARRIFKKIYDFPFLPRERRLYYEKLARDYEWDAVKEFINEGSNFLDVGCAEAYALKNAKKELKCTVMGVEPFLVDYDYIKDGIFYKDGIQIFNARAENLPFANNEFDVVYCSHVLEHVKDIDKCLTEMKRVLKKSGTMVIGVPTAAMAFINFFTHLFLLTPVTITNYFFYKRFQIPRPKFREIFIPSSHSDPKKTVFSDLSNYRTGKWLALVAKEFTIIRVLHPCLYPFHNYRQFFHIRKTKKISSSVFFICEK